MSAKEWTGWYYAKSSNHTKPGFDSQHLKDFETMGMVFDPDYTIYKLMVDSNGHHSVGDRVDVVAELFGQVWDPWADPEGLPEGYWRIVRYPWLMINREGVIMECKAGRMLLSYIDATGATKCKLVNIRDRDGILQVEDVDELVRSSIPPF